MDPHSAISFRTKLPILYQKPKDMILLGFATNNRNSNLFKTYTIGQIHKFTNIRLVFNFCTGIKKPDRIWNPVRFSKFENYVKKMPEPQKPD
jgi:hypothetical protein